MAKIIQLQMRRDTAALWTSTNPTPADGEWCMETDTRRIKIGDGVTAWTSLDYNPAAGTPVDNQIGVWTGATLLEGDSQFTWDGSILLVGGAALEVGADGATFIINHADATGDQFLAISGGTDVSSGANILLYGAAHATPNNMDLRGGANAFLTWNETLGIININTGVGGKTNAFTINASQVASFVRDVRTLETFIALVGDVSAGDTAAMGYSATNGLRLIGQGSAKDVTILNDTAAIVIAIPTGTLDVEFSGDVGVAGDIVLTGQYFVPGTSTTAALEDIANVVNTDAGKVQSAMVFNTTTNTPVWAVGNADGSVWVDGAGTTVHTPV